jgi:hypothetical protein
MSRALFKIGTLAGGTAGTTNLESLTTPVLPPKSTYSPYTSLKELADGSMRGVGAPVVTWRWSFLTHEMRDQLRLFCTGASASVYIRTYIKDSAGIPNYFLAKMIWPSVSEETDSTRAIDFVLIFKQLVLQADP